LRSLLFHRLLAIRPRSLLRGKAEEPVLALGQELLEMFDLELESRRVGALQPGVFHDELVKLFVKPVVLPIEQDCDLSQDLQVLFPLDLDHG
jgi:hypothetical protein